ncbi:hypothetical protein [Streptomyces telluris]|uniref:Uncharacterized protein n=1 Tax=Streptomyces telluris TaxID=2720021 RepID=A0A9X2LMH1_9ACTN|nr:hypothetical protein [Streptomyces telluris]MCQ8773875.1 hypothetical protein [Streptomyces telluris]NJP78689.1 hypothetical protein [Streptomyces telluris]
MSAESHVRPSTTAAVLPEDSRIPRAQPDSSATAEYDRYFHILRTPPDLCAWTRSCLDLQAAVLADLTHSPGLDDGQRTDILTGLLYVSSATLTSWLRATPGPVPVPEHHEPPFAGTRPGPGQSGEEQRDALRRWKLGHQLFHVLLATMNTVLDDTLAAAQDTRWPSLVQGMERLRVLYDAATATMAYASDFPPALYQDEIRPSMQPPFVGPGFSGVFNREHRAMTIRMHRLRRAVKDLPPEAGPADAIRHAALSLQAAQSRNHSSHVKICERCVPSGTSLLRHHLAQSSPREEPLCDS